MIDRSKNYNDIVDNITPTQDIHGNVLSVGDMVRSHDFPLICKDGRILGMETDPTIDRVSYCEAEVIAIGVDVVEGCARYTIRVHRHVCFVGARDYSHKGIAGDLLYPPLNGMRSTLGGVTFGVEKITQ